MIEGRRVLALVPARGGSKGVPRKNLREVGGVSLVARVGQVVRELVEIDRAVVSTDDDEIARVAEAAGLAAPFRRPPELSGDRVSDLEVLTHALYECERIDDARYDLVLMLQPTSPLRTPDEVRAALARLVDGGHDSVWTVSPVPLSHHPKKQLAISGASLSYLDKDGASVVARQQLEPTFVRNGVAYAFTRACLLEQRRILGHNAGFVVTRGHHVSIDSEEDFALVESLLPSAS